MLIKYRLLTFHPSHLTTYGIGHAALSIIDGMCSESLDCILVVPTVDNKVKSKNVKNMIPTFLTRLIYKIFSSSIIRALSEWFFLFQIKPNDIVYLWPGLSMALFRRVKAKGNTIVIENINCHQKISKKILDDEYQRLGIQNPNPITQEQIDRESEILQSCNYVFSPSPLVTQSLLDNGVPQIKILESSYGLHDYQQISTTSVECKPLEVIFVGRVGLRKGIHLLLEYWQAANINGTLKIIGNVEDSIKSVIESYKNIDNLKFISFVSDIDEVYKNADIFVLPSLEEGSPLVTYLALGAGLPCIVSPMGGQGVVTHNYDGFVIDPHDKSSWVNALENFANSPSLRQTFSQAARGSSNNFTWEKVGQQRATLLLEKLKGK
jgi:glycosyltransferase involved in cell wall biosynthesis